MRVACHFQSIDEIGRYSETNKQRTVENKREKTRREKCLQEECCLLTEDILDKCKNKMAKFFFFLFTGVSNEFIDD